MAGDDERHDLVEEGSVRHRLAAGLVAGLHQHRKPVGLDARCLATRLDDGPHEARQAAEAGGELQVAPAFFGQQVEGAAALGLDQAVEVLTEQRAQHDLEGDAAELMRQVDGFAAVGVCLPACEQVRVGPFDDRREAADGLALEGGLDHAALARPQVAVADDQAVPEQDAHTFEARALDVVAAVGQQHAADVFGIVDDEAVAGTGQRRNTADRAVARVQLLQHRQGLVIGVEVVALVGARRQITLCHNPKLPLVLSL